MPVCPTAARAPMIVRHTYLAVYPLLNVLAYCSFSHALASGVAVGFALICTLCLHLPCCWSICCQHTSLWVSGGLPLSANQLGRTGRRCGLKNDYSSTIATLSRVCGLRADDKMECRHGIVATGSLPFLRMSWRTTLIYPPPKHGVLMSPCRSRLCPLP